MLHLPDALGALRAYRQFIIFVLVPSQVKPGKMDKLPADWQTGRIHSAHDSAVWSDFDPCASAVERFAFPHGGGVGFALTKPAKKFLFDLDDCIDAAGVWSQAALNAVQYFAGCYMEVSTSGRGLHIMGSYSGDLPPHGCKNKASGWEFYHERRFVALNPPGAIPGGDVGFDCTHLLPQLIDSYFPPVEEAAPVEWTDAPVSAWAGPLDDDALIARIRASRPSSRAAFGGHATVVDLFDGNPEQLGVSYPDTYGKGRPYDGSAADLALAQHLAFWTGNDCARIERLMLRSALVRTKWERPGYLHGTILLACARQFKWLGSDRIVAAPPGTAGQTQEAEQGSNGFTPEGITAMISTPLPVGNFLGLTEQQIIFKNQIYIQDQNAILVPGGNILNPQQFRVLHGGHTFLMDSRNERTTRNAWEAFTESGFCQWPRAESTIFSPLRAPGEIITIDKRTYANTWSPAIVTRMKGDPTPFLNHMAKLFPDERDRTIVLCYMAAAVQYVGVKFGWCLFIQGVEGNGKTLITKVLQYAIGKRYAYFPKAAELHSRFNDWIYGKLLIGVEDIKVTEDQAAVWESLKPAITGEEIEVEGKGLKKLTREIYANFILNSNHKDGLKKTKNDRRIAPFFTPQQEAEDLERDGMGGKYFYDLYKWLKEENGYAICADFLQNYAIADEFNPATFCTRAPLTSSTPEALAVGLGAAEQHIMEAVSQGLPGFMGGYISSIMLARMLDQTGFSRRIPPNKRTAMLETLGYRKHPALLDGRVPEPVAPDNGKPRIYLRPGHLAFNVEKPTEIARLYSAAQMPDAAPPPPLPGATILPFGSDE